MQASSSCGAQASASDSIFSFGCAIIEHRRIVDHQDPFQVRQPVGDLQDLVDIFLIFRDEDRGAAILHLEFDLRHRGGRIDAVDDGAGRLRAHVAQHPFLAGVAHDRDAIALRQVRAIAKRARGGRRRRRNRASCVRDRGRVSWRDRRCRGACRAHARRSGRVRSCRAGFETEETDPTFQNAPVSDRSGDFRRGPRRRARCPSPVPACVLYHPASAPGRCRRRTKSRIAARGRAVPGDEFRRLVDAAPDLVLRFQFRRLARNQAENDGLALGHKAQGREIAGARGVVFEAIDIDIEAVEQRVGDGVIAAFAPSRRLSGCRGRDGSRCAWWRACRRSIR